MNDSPPVSFTLKIVLRHVDDAARYRLDIIKQSIACQHVVLFQRLRSELPAAFDWVERVYARLPEP